MKGILLILTGILLFLGFSNSAKILILTPLGSKSHLNAFMGMFKQLAEKGHQLTVVSAYGSSKKSGNIRDVVLPPKYSATSLVKNVFTEGSSGPMLNLLLNTPKLCSDSLTVDVIKELKNEKFDLILMSLFFSDCYFSLVHHFKVPYITMSPGGIMGLYSETVGNPYFMSLSGNILLEGEFPFSYFYRLKATLLDFVFGSLVKYYTYAKTESLCRAEGLCPPDMPSFHEFRANASLSFANSVKLLNPTPVPDMPHIIYAGGSHCSQAKPLPQDLEKWIQSSGKDGFIFFSLGSAVTPSGMPESSRKIFINVFSKLKQKVLWKWDGEMADLPSNVKIGKWLPQQDILAQPKMKLFLSHGGLLSIMESTFHGAKILGMPLYGDQHSNLREGATKGWADVLYWEDLTEELLEQKILSTINNKKMDAVVADRSKIMKDQPMPPKDEVVYWTEYVLRHNGASHLRSPVHHMPLYLLYNADVWLSIFSFLVVMLAISCCTVRSIFRRCFGKPKLISKKKKKQ